jgi:hypothetical protein
MKNLNEFLKGKDYSNKIDLFNEKISEIHENFNGEFDVENPYFIMETHPTEGEVKLTFDEKRQIPNKLKDRVLTEFKNIWK